MEIPQYKIHPIHTRKFRWVSTAAFAEFYCSPQYMCHFLAIGTDQTTHSNLYPAIGAVRLKRVEMWSSGAPTQQLSVGLTRTLTSATQYNLAPRVTDTSVNPSVPTHVLMTSKMAGCEILKEWFEVSDAAYLFSISGPQGTVVEVEMDFFLNVNINVNPGLQALTSGFGFPSIGLSPYDLGNTAGGRIILPQDTTGNVPIWN